MLSSFNDLGITSPILKALKDMGFEVPTEVQSRAIPHILNHEDLIVRSKTGSGKTAVFGVSMLQMTDAGKVGPPRADTHTDTGTGRPSRQRSQTDGQASSTQDNCHIRTAQYEC